QREAYDGYEGLLERDVARELARINLPLSMYTEWYWQIDLHNLFHFLRLRMDMHAQYEIRVYAEAMFEITKKVCPIAVEAFDEHIRGGVRFSRGEFGVLQRLLGTDGDGGDVAERIRVAAEAEGLSGRAVDRVAAKIIYGKMG
ncbi:MAG: FAD-dependent thymidylate synthase, partial [Alkalispirochaeta sp.]